MPLISTKGTFLVPALAVLVLFGATLWRYASTERPVSAVAEGAAAVAVATHDYSASLPSDRLASGAEAATSTGLTNLGTSIVGSMAQAYQELASSGELNENTLRDTGRTLAKSITPVIETKTYTEEDLSFTIDTSAERALKYRADLRDSLASLLKISRPEFEVYGAYVESKNPVHLEELKRSASLYKEAVSKTLDVTTPEDARAHHLAIINAMQTFGSTLDALSSHATDPFASAALLKSYNQAEESIAFSFQGIAEYFKTKVGASTSAL